MTRTIQAVLDQQEPDAARFPASNGKLAGLLVVDLQEAFEVAAEAEPSIFAFGALIEWQPVRTPADLAQARPAIEQVVEAYG